MCTPVLVEHSSALECGSLTALVGLLCMYMYMYMLVLTDSEGRWTGGGKMNGVYGVEAVVTV